MVINNLVLALSAFSLRRLSVLERLGSAASPGVSNGASLRRTWPLASMPMVCSSGRSTGVAEAMPRGSLVLSSASILMAAVSDMKKTSTTNTTSIMGAIWKPRSGLASVERLLRWLMGSARGGGEGDIGDAGGSRGRHRDGDLFGGNKTVATNDET